MTFLTGILLGIHITIHILLFLLLCGTSLRAKEYEDKINKAIYRLEEKQKDINNGGNDMGYTQITHLIGMLKGNDDE